MCPLRHQTTDGINAICCRIKHNRAKPMFEPASAIFSIADAGEFRFARFYIVYEEVPLGTPESPLIVCGLSDTLRECPNVAKTRHGMPATAWKKYTNFASKNLPPSVYSGTFLFSGLLIILPIRVKYGMFIAAVPDSNSVPFIKSTFDLPVPY